MTRSRLAFLLVSLAVLAPLLGGALVLGAAVGEGAAPDSLYRWLSVFTDVFGLVRNAYVEPTEAGQLMDGAMEGVGDALDPFSVYLPPGKMETFLAARERAPLRSGLAVLRARGLVYVVGG